jgi:hypothetical protein
MAKAGSSAIARSLTPAAREAYTKLAVVGNAVRRRRVGTAFWNRRAHSKGQGDALHKLRTPRWLIAPLRRH